MPYAYSPHLTHLAQLYKLIRIFPSHILYFARINRFLMQKQRTDQAVQMVQADLSFLSLHAIQYFFYANEL